MFVRSLTYTAALAVGLFINGAHAGAGANVYGCISGLKNPDTVYFSRHTADCFDADGNDAQLEVPDSGLYCVSVGYVERCWRGDGNWRLIYNVGQRSENALTHWDTTNGWNNVGMYKPPPGTFACGDKRLCSDNGVGWDAGKVGTFYIIFQPDYSPSSNIENHEEEHLLVVQPNP